MLSFFPRTHSDKYIGGYLLEEYELSTEKKAKLDISVNDLRYALRYHWGYDQYATERQGVQLSLLILLFASTV